MSNGQNHKPEDSTRQCVKYSFFKVDPIFRRLPEAKQSELKLELIDTIRGFNRRMLLRPYSLVGLRGDVDFLLWQVAEEIDAFNALAKAILSTGMGAYLQMPYSMLAMTRKSIYDIGVTDEGEEADRLIIQPGDGKVFVCVPVRQNARLVRASARRTSAHDDRAYPRRAQISANQAQHDLQLWSG